VSARNPGSPRSRGNIVDATCEARRSARNISTRRAGPSYTHWQREQRDWRGRPSVRPVPTIMGNLFVRGPDALS